MKANDVRKIIGPDRILGVSAQTVEQAVEAEKTAPITSVSVPYSPHPQSLKQKQCPLKPSGKFAARYQYR